MYMYIKLKLFSILLWRTDFLRSTSIRHHFLSLFLSRGAKIIIAASSTHNIKDFPCFGKGPATNCSFFLRKTTSSKKWANLSSQKQPSALFALSIWYSRSGKNHVNHPHLSNLISPMSLCYVQHTCKYSKATKKVSVAFQFLTAC